MVRSQEELARPGLINKKHINRCYEAPPPQDELARIGRQGFDLINKKHINRCYEALPQQEELARIGRQGFDQINKKHGNRCYEPPPPPTPPPLPPIEKVPVTPHPFPYHYKPEFPINRHAVLMEGYEMENYKVIPLNKAAYITERIIEFRGQLRVNHP